VQRRGAVAPTLPPGWADHTSRLGVTSLVGAHAGAVHTGWSLCTLGASGHLDTHLHSFEQSFFVLAGTPLLTVDGRTYRLSANECGLLPVAVPHAWRNAGSEDATWLEVSSPAPRLSGPADTFWTGERERASDDAQPLDIRDPRTRTFFRLDAHDMDLDSRKIGAAVDAPTVSASMATALLAYSGIAVKMLVDPRLGAVLHQMFMVEYEPGGVAQPHDHPFEETYYVLDGEVDAMADGEEFTLGPGDVFWTGVGCIHAFYNRSPGRVRFLETQSPQPPSSYSYRFNRDWDHLASTLQEQRRQETLD
jgi:mannose-6-phosphate isomerase-like protein (cupin superfamily)